MRPLPTLLTLAIAAAFGGFVATGINAHLDNRADAAPLPAVLPTTAALPASVAGQAVPSLAPMLEKAMPAVVSVNTKQVIRVRNPFFNDPFFRRLFPDIPQERINESLGSGVIIDAKEGLVLTNHHVIDNADDVQVTLADGRTVKAEFLGSDRDTDIALIRIPAQNLTDIKLGNSDQLRVGDFVVAIGNPFGFSPAAAAAEPASTRVISAPRVSPRPRPCAICAVRFWLSTPSVPRTTTPCLTSWSTTLRARLEGIARPRPMLPAMLPCGLKLAVLMPTSWPCRSTSAPPELPGLIDASVWMKFW